MSGATGPTSDNPAGEGPRAPGRSTVRLCIPADLAFVRLTRLVVSGLATQSAFSLDETEDLRIAVDELCSILVDAALDGAEVELTFTLVGGHLSLEASVPAHADPIEPDELSSHILAATVDSHHVSFEGARAVARMEKTCATRAT